MKQEYLIVYDYGTGGIWGIAVSESEKAITKVFPELKVIHERPEWMSSKQFADLSAVSRFVVGDSSTYPSWLHSLINGRE